MRTNFHTHTQRCCHASGSEENYVDAAIKSGVAILGFSDHAPFPDRDYGYRMQFEELPDYLRAIDESAERHRGKIRLYKGLETEYVWGYDDYYRQLLDVYGLDYLALGEHVYNSSGGDIKNIFFAKSSGDYVDYARAVCMAMDTGFFTFVAHPDVMFTNNIAFDDNCQRAMELIIDCAIKHDMILEFNANGYRKGVGTYDTGDRYPYPYDKFWELVSKTELRVTVGSDCHDPGQIFDEYMILAIEKAREYKLRLIDDIFRQR